MESYVSVENEVAVVGHNGASFGFGHAKDRRAIEFFQLVHEWNVRKRNNFNRDALRPLLTEMG